jgi:hypothetical protein
MTNWKLQMKRKIARSENRAVKGVKGSLLLAVRRLPTWQTASESWSTTYLLPFCIIPKCRTICTMQLFLSVLSFRIRRLSPSSHHPSFLPSHPSIDPSIHPCIHASMHPCIHASMHPSIYASIHLCIHACMHPSVDPPPFLFISPFHAIELLRTFKRLPNSNGGARR